MIESSCRNHGRLHDFLILARSPSFEFRFAHRFLLRSPIEMFFDHMMPNLLNSSSFFLIIDLEVFCCALAATKHLKTTPKIYKTIRKRDIFV